ncbi:DUF2339 domain-containing protein [Croceicoccus sp. BE223]|uniref:DUF2339 domain-containing protein n=1 Tax=Croceicoccus sp. BE223 TaxID=2817716 RepID=UPI00285E6A32|nr:DUF2339 domain-containing protein [Croceicoccus sp. BE223]MDR7102742.1 putative membrane protein [Croceicoccus sp. BE223]
MEWLIIIGLGVALYQLWRRIERLEERLSMQEMLARRPVVPVAKPAATASAEPARQPEPARASASVPAARRAVARVIAAASPTPAETRSDNAAPEPRRTLSVNFEELFGRQLPIWAGGITLAVAGFFIVLYAIDLGLLSPTVRVLLGFLTGAALLGGAFVADTMRERIRDPRVPQALAGAGLATLYACFYLAGTGYGLIGAGPAFAGLALVTAGAVWLSFRFGLPCAVIGLLGGFAAPVMVTSDNAQLPILSVYLALVSAGLTLTGNRQERPWLGMAALGGALLWGVGLLLAQRLDPWDELFVGAYLIAVGVVLPAALVDAPWRRWLRAGAGALAAVQMAALVSHGGFSLMAWGLYGLLGAALAVLGCKRADLREASAFAAAVALVMLLAWTAPMRADFAIVAAGLALVFAAVPLALVWRGGARAADVVQLAGAAFGLAFATVWHFGDLSSAEHEPLLALACAALAALPALAAWRTGGGHWRGWLLETSAAAAMVAALSQVMVDEWAAVTCALLAVATALVMPLRIAAARVFLFGAAVFALYPLAVWMIGAGAALAGDAMLYDRLPKLVNVARYLVPSAFAGLLVAWRQAAFGDRRVTIGIGALAGAGSAIALHVLFRQAFPLADEAAFVAQGLAERTAWQALLLGGGAAAWFLRERLPALRWAAQALIGLSLLHFAWFSLLLHNPLWDEQAVGRWPVLNLALAAYGVAFAGLALLRRMLPARWRAWPEAAIMALLPVLAITLLRQVFAGSILSAVPLGQGEDLLRSLIGIVLAAGYLAWGAPRADRAWRIGSLVLMLLAVGKVFLVDAAVLDGLARIASFLALGFSLIGIGWFYSRILSAPSPASAPAMPAKQDM